MKVRYRYRIEPTSAQREGLARVFGCARVVYNDAIRLRESVRAAGGKIGPAAVQSAVTAKAKATPERAWLAEVSADALIQAVRDCHTAYANFFASMSGKRAGRKVGHPRFRSRKDNRQSVRFTRNGFRLDGNGRLYVAKVGWVKVRWSRGLPSEPSSVTVIREPDGTFYASFVVDRDPVELAETGRECGVDLGLRTLAVIADTDGGLTAVPNPRHLARKLRYLARVQRQHGRTVHVVDRWYPSSKTCNRCGHRLDSLALSVRTWTCPGCGATLDRDGNAAVNILAAGQAERRNVCGAHVRPPSGAATGDEAETTPGRRQSHRGIPTL